MSVPFPPDERERLRALRRYAILDTPPEAAFDRIARLTARVLEVPIVLVSFIDERRQWYKARHGVRWRAVPREASVCSYTILRDEVTVVPDLSRDRRFAHQPYVTGPAHLRFYAGVPLKSPDGFNLGTLCAIDTRTREFGPEQELLLRDFAALTADELRLRLGLAEGRLASIVESSADAIISQSLNGDITNWNAAAERLFGYPAEEALGRPVTCLLPPDRLDEGTQIVAQLRRGRPLTQFETVRRRKDGRLIDVSLTISPLRDGQGRVVGASQIARDITERKRVEARLRQSEERFRRYFELGLIGMATTSPGKGFIEVNDQLCAILGYSRDELLGLTWDQLIHPDDLAADVAQFNRVLAGELDAYTLDKRFMRKDGTVIDTTISVSCLRRDNGSVDYFVGLLEDITARKATEAERDGLLASERTARRAAEAANAAKDQLLAMVSHELRTPLAAVQMMLYALRDQKRLTVAGRRAVELIGRSVELEALLIDDLLDVSRIVHGKLALERSRVDLHACVRQALELSRADLERKGLQLVVALAAAPSQVWGDAARLQQVFWNLFTNAAKFTSRGGRVTVHSRNFIEAGELKVAVEVADTGVGIEPDALDKIFAPLEQGSAGAARRQGGLGLGLAICHGIVSAHGGRLTAASPGPGQGATFTVELSTAEASGKRSAVP